MGKLLTILGVSEDKQSKLPESVFKAEMVINGLQSVYANAPESAKKDQLSVVIAETVKVLMAKIQPYLIEEKKEAETKKETEKLPKEIKLPEPPAKEQPKPTKPELPKPEVPKPEVPKPEAPKDKPKKEDKPPKKGEPPTPPTKPKKPKPKPEPPKSKPEEEEPLTCSELKDAIKGLILIAKMGDTEAANIIKDLKLKLKTQNC
jgi:hypothetical protein